MNEGLGILSYVLVVKTSVDKEMRCRNTSYRGSDNPGSCLRRTRCIIGAMIQRRMIELSIRSDGCR